MAIRIIEYQIEILRTYSLKKRGRKTKIPLIIPIVLYTGDKKWDAKEYIVEMEETLNGYISEEFGRYLVVDMNKYKKENLVQMKGMLSKIVLLDSSKSQEELKENYKLINKYKMNEEEKELLDEYTYNVASKILNKNDLEEVNREIIEEKGGKSMLLEVMLEAKKKIEIQKRKVNEEKRKASEKVKDIVKEMLKNNLNIETIKKCTKLSEEEILKLKDSI